METTGEMPGWIHKHKAELFEKDSTILLTGGTIERGENLSLIENIDDWQLDLQTRVWKCVAKRDWPRWEVSREDNRSNSLWEIRQALWSFNVGWKEDYEESLLRLEDELGMIPDVKSVESLYRPAIVHEPLPDQEEEYDIYRIIVEKTVVRYVEDSHCVQITVEGELPELTVRHLVEDVREKLSKLENRKYVAAKIAV